MIIWILREFRSIGYRIWIILFAIALGIGAITAVQGLADSIRTGIADQSKPLQAGDVVARSMHPFPKEYPALQAQFTQSQTKEMFSMASAEQGQSILVELKSVSKNYPLYGEVSLASGAALQDNLQENTVVVEQSLLHRLQLKLADELLLNGVKFTIVDIVLSESDKLNVGMSSGPRVFLSIEGLKRSNLEQFGSRITHKLQWKVSSKEKEELLNELNKLGVEHPHIGIQADNQGTPSTQRSINNTEQFMSLVALLSLLIGMIGVVQSLQNWLHHRRQSIAVFRCLGLSNREIFTLYLSVITILATFGSILGLVIAYLGMLGLMNIAEQYLPIQFIPKLSIGNIIENIVLGVVVSLFSSFPTILRLVQVAPIIALREGIELPKSSFSSRFGWNILYVLLILGTAYWQAQSILISAGFTGAILSLLGLIYLLLIPLRKILGTIRFSSWRYRHALGNFLRPELKNSQAMVALAMGIMVITTISLMESSIQKQFGSIALSEAPSNFFVDIQPDQWPEVELLLRENQAQYLQSAPVVMARLSKIRGIPIGEIIQDKPETERWAFTREQRLSYAQEIDPKTIIEGAFLSLEAQNELCLETRYANRLGVSVGDELTFDVQGIPLDFIVTATRRIEWETLQMNFFLVGEKEFLLKAPQFQLATAQLTPANEEKLQGSLTQRFPNISIISMREITKKVMVILENLSLAIQVLGGFSILIGILILLGSIQASLTLRKKQTDLFHMMGVTKKEISNLFFIEFSLLGFCASFIGASVAWILCWSCLHFIFRIAVYPNAGLMLGWIIFGTILTSISTHILIRYAKIFS